MNKRELCEYAREHGFEDTTELAAAILYKAADAEDLEDELAETKRRLDLAVLREKEAKAKLAEVKKARTEEQSDQERIDALLDELGRSTARAVEDSRVKLDGRKAGVMWRLT